MFQAMKLEKRLKIGQNREDRKISMQFLKKAN